MQGTAPPERERRAGDAGRAPLFDRTGETSELASTLARLSGGHGVVHVVEGPAGIGKTALLGRVRTQARDLGIRVLAARASELEVDYAFAVVHQLFDAAHAGEPQPGRLARWVDGPGGQAAKILRGSRAGAPGWRESDVGFAVLHGLYWLTVDLSDAQPLLLVVDDAHWADEPSLRFLQFLANRLDTAPVGILLGARRGRDEVARLAGGDQSRVSRPGALSRSAVQAWLTHELDATVTEAFAAAVHAAGDGSPFLVRELIAEIGRQRIEPTDSSAGAVADLTPDTVQSAVSFRLAGLGPAALRVADALAVLENGAAAALADLAGVRRPDVAAALDELRERGLITGDGTCRFQHPVMRTAVHSAIPVAARAALHERAARQLSSGPDVTVVAGHLLLASCREPWAADVLRAAARHAIEVDAPLLAATYLRRLLELTPAGSVAHLEATLDLSDSLHTADPAQALTLLEQARAVPVSRPEHRVRAMVGIARIERLRGRGAAVVTPLLALQRSLPPAETRLRALVDAELLATSSVSCAARTALLPWARTRLATAPSGAPEDYLLAASSAFELVANGEDGARAAELAAYAAAGARDAVDDAMYGHVMSLVGLTYLATDRLNEAAAVFDSLVTETSEACYLGQHAMMLAQRSSVALAFGRLVDAEADAERALRLGATAPTAVAMMPRAAATMLSVAVYRGEVAPARPSADELNSDSMTHQVLVYAQADSLFAAGHHAAAADSYLAFGRREIRLGRVGVARAWRSRAALALHTLGRDDEAHPLVADELAIAERAGTPSVIARALRAKGLLAAGSRRRELLAEAAAVLDRSPLALLRAEIATDLALAQIEQGELADARQRLRDAHDVASGSGAVRLQAVIDAALVATGARPLARRSSGIGALTPSERTVARHAREGMTNRQIAKALFVTEKTVEAHLSSAYRKLRIRSRRELPSL